VYTIEYRYSRAFLISLRVKPDCSYSRRGRFTTQENVTGSIIG